ncbi:MAG: putative glycosyltransferase [Roseivirga sp.]|jgi:predicted glycosyltransferase
MRALIDIGHPAHVHYFKNFIRVFEAQGNEVIVTARKKEMSHELLDLFNIPYTSRGTGKNDSIGKLLYLPKGNWVLLKKAIAFKPDIFLSFSSPYAAQVSFLLNKPHMAFDDTEHAKLGRLMYKPFTNRILSPQSFKDDLGKKQQLFDGYMELLYLHPKYFSPRPEVKKILGLNEGERYCILRFVSWEANHDIGHDGVALEMKRKLVAEFSKYVKVFISSETELPPDLEPYKFKISPDWMHDTLYYSDMFFGESATMASESAVLGVPAIYLDDVGRGYTDDLEKHGLVFNFTESKDDQESALQQGIKILKNGSTRMNFSQAHQAMMESKIDVTQFLLDQVNLVVATNR